MDLTRLSQRGIHDFTCRRSTFWRRDTSGRKIIQKVIPENNTNNLETKAMSNTKHNKKHSGGP